MSETYPASLRYQSFVRSVVAALSPESTWPGSAYRNDLTPEQRVTAAVRLTDALLVEGGFELTDTNATAVAAIIAVGIQGS